MNKQRKGKRLLSSLLCLSLVLSGLSVPTGTVQAEEACQSQGEESAVTYETASVTYLSCDENGQNWETKTCDAATVLTSDMTTLESGWYVLNSDVTFSSQITVSGSVNLILTDGCTLTANKGVKVNEGNTLSIYGQSADTGAIKATGKEAYPGIGSGNLGISPGTIIIYGGSVTAIGSGCGAGIGGCYGCRGGTTTIYGGVIEATGSNGAAGIGSGTSNDSFFSGRSSGDIDIYGGIIFAAGTGRADDIGAGQSNVDNSKGSKDVTIECGLIFDRNGNGTVYGDFF